MKWRGAVKRANVDSKSFATSSERRDDAGGDLRAIDCPAIVQALIRGAVDTDGGEYQRRAGVDRTFTVRRTICETSDGHDRPVAEHDRHGQQLNDILAVVAAHLRVIEIEGGWSAINRQHARGELQYIVTDAVRRTIH